MSLRVTVLSENTTSGQFKGEHGLSLYIEYGEERILLDAGRSELFYENAKLLGVDLAGVDYAVLSHSHYDHADGLERFFEINKNAKLYARREFGECYYSEHDGKMRYIGPKKGMLERYRDRFVLVEEESRPVGKSGAVLLAHKTGDSEKTKATAGLYKLIGEEYVPDDFSHEQTLILPTAKGMVVFNSCSHVGAAAIVREVMAYDDARPIYAYIGGYHLFKSTDAEILAFIETLKTVEVERLITGHCTGDRACELLRDAFGERIEQMHAGMVIEL